MNSIKRLSFALIMFSLFSILYVNTISAIQPAGKETPESTAMTDTDPGKMVPPVGASSTASPTGGPGLVPLVDASSTASPTGGPGLVPSEEPTSSNGITGWLRGIIGGDKPKTDLNPPTGK